MAVSRRTVASFFAEVLAFWQEQNVFERSVTSRNGAPPFTFYEGPPTANGRPGVHHVISRLCKDIDEDACRATPRSFAMILCSYLFTKLGDAVANPKTTLAWLMSALGAPVVLTGLLVPLRESGSLIPQLAIAAYVRRKPVRKWVWMLGAVLQAVAVAGLFTTGTPASSAVAAFSAKPHAGKLKALTCTATPRRGTRRERAHETFPRYRQDRTGRS